MQALYLKLVLKKIIILIWWRRLTYTTGNRNYCEVDYVRYLVRGGRGGGKGYKLTDQ